MVRAGAPAPSLSIGTRTTCTALPRSSFLLSCLPATAMVTVVSPVDSVRA